MPSGQQVFTTVNVDGSVSFDFNGHISAAGIDMISGTTASPPNDRRIRWHQDPSLSGAVLAEIYSFSGGPSNDDLVLQANSPDGTGQARLDLFASNTVAITPSEALVTLDGGLAQAKILDTDLNSQFIQDGQALNLDRKIQFWGPFVVPSGNVVPTGGTSVTFTHNLGIPGLQTLVGFIGIAAGNSGLIWNVTGQAANFFTVEFVNLTTTTKNGQLACYITSWV